jgi:hypothetical protein
VGVHSFEVALLDIERRGTTAVTVTVMGLGVFMNAGIAHAFDDSPWRFVIPATRDADPFRPATGEDGGSGPREALRCARNE